MFNKNWGFDFKVSITKHIVSMAPGKQISIPFVIELIHGKRQPIAMDVNTRWDSVGLTSKITPDSFDPSQPWQGTMMIRAAINTPPGSYLFTVRGSTTGTFKTSEDAVTVVVDPKAEQKEDEDDNIQPEQIKNETKPSFSLDKLFAPGVDPGSGEYVPAPTGNAAWDRLTADERKKIEQQTKAGGVIGLVLGLIIVGAIMFVVMSKIDWKRSGVSNGCPSLNCGEQEPGGVTVWGGTVPTNCPCPSGCPYVYKSGMAGYKQCSSLRPH